MNQIVLLVLIALIWLIKITLCNYWMYHSLLVSSLWKHPMAFLSFWIPKFVVSFCLSFLCLLMCRWAVLLLLLSDLWMEANIVYKRANNRVIDYYALKLTGNMNGFWNSVIIYIWLKDLLMVLLTGLIYFLCLFGNDGFSIISIIIGLLALFILQIIATH